ncbi:MAG: hypothetical protein QW591_01670 [Candidatus Micrarchaeaceae archaeon]
MHKGSVIILDTSAMVFSMRNRIDIFDVVRERFPGHAILISEGIIKELERFSRSKQRIGKYAKLLLMNIRRSDIKIDKDNGYVDSWILKAASESQGIVCTNDIALKRKLEANGIKVFSISRKGLLR